MFQSGVAFRYIHWPYIHYAYILFQGSLAFVHHLGKCFIWNGWEVNVLQTYLVLKIHFMWPTQVHITSICQIIDI